MHLVKANTVGTSPERQNHFKTLNPLNNLINLNPKNPNEARIPDCFFFEDEDLILDDRLSEELKRPTYENPVSINLPVMQPLVLPPDPEVPRRAIPMPQMKGTLFSHDSHESIAIKRVVSQYKIKKLYILQFSSTLVRVLHYHDSPHSYSVKPGLLQFQPLKLQYVVHSQL